MSFDTPFAQTLQQPIAIRSSKWKLLLMAAGSLAFVVIGIWMIRSSQSSNASFAGLVAVIFFGVGLVGFLALMVLPSLLLTIDDEGIHCHYPFWHPLTITWEEIACIRPIKMRFITIFAVDVSPAGKQTYLARNFKKGKVPFNMRQVDTPAMAISISLSTANLSYIQAISQIQERFAVQIARYQILIYKK